MTYLDVLQRLLPARRFGVKLGLERMRALLDRLGAPDRRLGRTIHVGGTNGKGSTVAMIAAMARAAGLRVATYTSPHLSCLRERIAIDGEMIDEAAFVAAAEAVSAAGGDELTFFEQITAIAMVAIAGKVDVTVLEVGLGGRFDATNVVDADVAAVTGVALDHQNVLGDTLEAIAREKAGIFKPGKIAIIGNAGEPAAVPALVAAAPDARVVDQPANVPVSLIGAHQQRNAAVAIAAIEALGIAPRTDALVHVVHPGRFERIGGVILDGAHNPHGAAALTAALASQPRGALVIAVSADKDVDGIAAALAPAFDRVVATRYQQARALDPEQLARHFARRGLATRTAPDLRAALALAGVPAVVAGSLFLVGEARVLLLGAPADPFVVTDPPA